MSLFLCETDDYCVGYILIITYITIFMTSNVYLITGGQIQSFGIAMLVMLMIHDMFCFHMIHLIQGYMK